VLRGYEKIHRSKAHNDLNAYCQHIEIPGVPVNDDPDCEQFYPDNVTPAKHHVLINNTLMRVEAGDIKRLMIFMPPGSAKSSYGTVVFPTWFMGRKPGRNVICTSYGSTLAQRFGRKCRQITRSKQFREIFDTELVSDNRAADNWALQNSSTYMAAGILAGITGNRADGLIIDDPIKGRADSDSVTIRDKVWEAYKTDLRTRLKPGGFITIIQTRWHEDDLSGRILPKNWQGESGWVTAQDGEQWYVISLPAECNRHDDPLGRKIGEWLWTDWFSVAHWEQEKRTQGERNWSALYQQRPTPTEGGIFKRHWFQRYGSPAEDGIIIQSIDTGNKPGELNDPSVIGTWRISRDGYQLLHVWRDRVDFPTLKRSAKSAAMQWQPSGIIIEDKASGTQLIQELRADPAFQFSVIPFDPSPHGDKIMRANDVSPTVESGRVFLPESAPWLLEFEAEIFAFPVSATKDQVDMLSQFLKWAHRHTVALTAWGSGKLSEGIAAMGDSSTVDESVGYGVIRSGTNTEGF
jgi:predicted phage terminase large subunit-like protein